MRVLKLIVVTGLGYIFLATVALVANGLNHNVANAGVIVVSGHAVTGDGTPSPRLQSRLDVPLKLFRERLAPLISRRSLSTGLSARN
jgi:hypothetical protein